MPTDNAMLIWLTKRMFNNKSTSLVITATNVDGNNTGNRSSSIWSDKTNGQSRQSISNAYSINKKTVLVPSKSHRGAPGATREPLRAMVC